jgi:acyl-CoA synthetase (NDP forming)
MTATLSPVDEETVRAVLDEVRAAGRDSLTAPEGKRVCDAYGIPTPSEGLATSADEAAKLAGEIGTKVVAKIVSPDILHKTEAGGVIVGIEGPTEARAAFEKILSNAKAYKADAEITGVQIQEMVGGGQEVIVGATTDGTFGKIVAFGLGGVLVEVLKDVTFRLAPLDVAEARGMVTGIKAAEVLQGARGAEPVDLDALADVISKVSKLVTDFPEISEFDLNPVFASASGAVAADVRILLETEARKQPVQHSQEDILQAMNRLMNPRSVAVIGASDQAGKIGNSIMKNLINGGYEGEIYPINPKADEIQGRKAYKSVGDVPGEVDVAVFAVPAKFVPAALTECGKKGVTAAVMIPSGFAETGNVELQDEVVGIAHEYGIRMLGPNIYGYYYTPRNLCATFCTPYDVKGGVALTSQSGGIGMAILGFARTTKMGVSAIVGLGNKSDVDEDDLLTFFEHDDNTQCVAMHLEDLKDGRAFVETAKRMTKKKPVVVLKAGRTAMGARAASSHTGALAGDDKVYDDILRQAGVVRAPGLNEMLEYARGLPLDLDEAFRAFIPPFGAAGNPIDITGGEPPSTYEATIRLGLEDPRIHALILGYWHTIVTPPMVFAELTAKVVEEARAKGIDKPVVASLAGDTEVEQASDYLFEHRIVAYPYTTERPVAVLGAKYRWARAAGLVGG